MQFIPPSRACAYSKNDSFMCHVANLQKSTHEYGKCRMHFSNYSIRSHYHYTHVEKPNRTTQHLFVQIVDITINLIASRKIYIIVCRPSFEHFKHFKNFPLWSHFGYFGSYRITFGVYRSCVCVCVGCGGVAGFTVVVHNLRVFHSISLSRLSACVQMECCASMFGHSRKTHAE